MSYTREVAICKVPLAGIWHKKHPYYVSQGQVFVVKRCNQFGNYLIGFRNGSTGNIKTLYISDEKFREYFNHYQVNIACLGCPRIVFFNDCGKCEEKALRKAPWLCHRWTKMSGYKACGYRGRK